MCVERFYAFIRVFVVLLSYEMVNVVIVILAEGIYCCTRAVEPRMCGERMYQLFNSI